MPKSKRKPPVYAFAITSATTLRQLKAIKRRDGIPLAEQVRRGIDMWLKAKRGRR